MTGVYNLPFGFNLVYTVKQDRSGFMSLIHPRCASSVSIASTRKADEFAHLHRIHQQIRFIYSSPGLPTAHLGKLVLVNLLTYPRVTFYFLSIHLPLR